MEFLNTDRVYKVNYPDYKILEKFIQKFKIKSAKNFVNMWRKNKFKNNSFYVTAKPDARYKDKGWVSWQKFLGNRGRIYSAADAYTFEKFLKVCKIYNIKNSRDWRHSNKRKKDDKMPSKPEKFYKEWTSWQEVFNSNRGTKKNFLSFVDARKFARSLNFKNTKQWRDFVKTNRKPLNITAQPQMVYKNHFKDYKDFLGYERSFRKSYPPFNEIKKIVKKLKFISASDYMKNFHKNKRFSKILNARPQTVYAKEWKGWEDYLDNKNRKYTLMKKKYLEFYEIKKFVKNKKIKTKEEWYKAKLPNKIPRSLNKVFTKEWKGWPDFLGTSTKPRSRKS